MAYQGVFENKFAPSYMRNHKAITVKNLRCFPRCGPEHKDNGFCGNEVIVKFSTGGRVDPTEYQTFSEFNEAESEPRFKVNQTYSEAAVHNVSTLMPGDVQESDMNHGTLHFSRETKGWHYGWMAGRGNGTQALHEMRVFLFEKVDPQTLVCRLVLRSPQFQVTSRKRIRPKKSASGEDGKKKRSKRQSTNDDDDEDDDDESSEEDEKAKGKPGRKKAGSKKEPVEGKVAVAPVALVKEPTKVQSAAMPQPQQLPRSTMNPPPFGFNNLQQRRPPVFMGDSNRPPTENGHGNGSTSMPQVYSQYPMNSAPRPQQVQPPPHQQPHAPMPQQQHLQQQQYSLPPPSQQQQQQQPHQQSQVPQQQPQPQQSGQQNLPYSSQFSQFPAPLYQGSNRPQHQSSITSNPPQSSSAPGPMINFSISSQLPPQSRTPHISWPYGLSSTPPIYLPSLTPPMYQHGISTTPPMFFPLMSGIGGGVGTAGDSTPFSAMAFQAPPNTEGGATEGDVLSALWNPTPPSVYSSFSNRPLPSQVPLQQQPRENNKQ